MIRVAWYAAVALLTVAALVLLWEVREAIFLFLLSLVVAAALRPGVRMLARRGLPSLPALLVTYLLVICSLTAVAALAGGPLVRDLESAADTLMSGYQRAVLVWPQSGNSVQQALARQLPPPQDLAAVLTGPQGVMLAQRVLGVASGFLDLAGKLSLVFILSLYWSVDQTHFERLWLSLVSVKRRATVRDVWRSAESCVGAYLRAEVTLSVVSGMVLALGYAALGVPFAAVLGLFAALARLIPWVGSLLAVLPAILLAWTVGPLQALLVAVLGLGLLYTLEIVLKPRILCRERYSALVTAIVLVTLAYSYGLVGILLAPLVSVMIQVLVLGARRAPAVEAGRAVELGGLQQRLARLKERVSAEGEPPTPEVASLLQRLEDLLTRASNL